MISIVRGLILTALLLSVNFSVAAESQYPSKPLKIVVPTAAGGASDTTARIIADELSRRFKQAVVVENKPGASGTIAARYVAEAPADGYTLFFGTGSTHVVAPLMLKNITYDPVKDFTPLTFVGRAPFVIFINSKLPVNNLKELIAYAKNSPTPLNFGTSGPATIYEIAALLLEQEAQIKLNHIPYKGLSPMALDVSAGRVEIGVGPIDGYLDSDKLKVLAVLGSHRSPTLTKIPSAAESGYPNFEVPAWAAIWGPAKMPPLAATKIKNTLQTILTLPEVKEKISNTGIVVDVQSSAFLTKIMNDNLELARKAVAQ